MSSSPASEPTAVEREQSLVELVKLDYDVTLRTITGVLATGTAIRVAGFTAWAGLTGLGIRDDSWALCAAAAALVGLFMYVDAHHAALYARALHRAIKLETLLDRYADRLGIDADDEDAVLRAVGELETHRFGIYRTMPKPRRDELLRARPYPVFRALYPSLVTISVSAALIIGL